MTDKAVAEADLITLVPGLELRFSPSAESCWWRTLRSTRSVVAPRGPCGSGRPRTVALLGRGNIASAGLKCLSAKLNPTVNNSVIKYRFRVTSDIVLSDNFLPAAVSPLLSLRNGLRSPWEGIVPIAPSREAPLAFTGGCLVCTCSSVSTSRGEARRCVSMRAEKRLRAPDGGLESLSVKEDSEQDKRFL